MPGSSVLSLCQKRSLPDLPQKVVGLEMREWISAGLECFLLEFLVSVICKSNPQCYPCLLWLDTCVWNSTWTEGGWVRLSPVAGTQLTCFRLFRTPRDGLCTLNDSTCDTCLAKYYFVLWKPSKDCHLCFDVTAYLTLFSLNNIIL